MEAVVGLMLLLGLSHGADVYCDGRQNVAQCYGALGGTVDVQLMDSTSGIFKYQWMKNKTIILDVRQNVIVTNRIENRSILTPSNGTFRINNLNRKDGDEYELNTYDSNGKASSPKTLHLIIQAPVSSVLLVSECVSEGQVRASCSSEGGDSPQYSWTLDGHNLTDAELLSGHGESDTIALKPHVSGRLVCSVWNQVSNVSKEKIITNCVFINCTLSNGTRISQWMFAASETLCVESTTVSTRTMGKKTEITESSRVTPTNITSSNQTLASVPWYSSEPLYLAAGVLSALILLLVVGVVICGQMKKKRNKPKEDNEEDLTYADVRIMQRKKTQAEQREEVEVEYGQVRFSARQQSVATAGDDCVYSKVRKDK